MSVHSARGLSPGLRWLSVVLRTLHIVATVMIGIAIFAERSTAVGAGLALATGIALCAFEWWRHPAFWREIAGIVIAAKLALLAAIVWAPGLTAAVFWIVLVASSIISHAPRAFRHRRVLG